MIRLFMIASPIRVFGTECFEVFSKPRHGVLSRKCNCLPCALIWTGDCIALGLVLIHLEAAQLFS